MDLSGLDVILTILATWRLSSLLVNEEGPFAIFSRIRHFVGIRRVPIQSSEGPLISTVALNPIAELLTCVWCTSIWGALVILLISMIPIGEVIRLILAVSSGAIFINEMIEWLRSQV
jgi:hypothetical protein